jgi:pimeloyl-ACP methyl ester carboxylesterase
MSSAPLHSASLLASAIILLLPLTLAAQQPNLLAAAPPAIEAPVAKPPLAKATHLPLIVIGFAGGFVRSTNLVHGEVAVAHYLAKKYGDTIHSEIFENHHGDDAYKEILHIIATQHDPTPTVITAADKQAARIILYGHSWGASEAVAVARQLQRDHIPVLLLIQVDGVPKFSSTDRDDSIIPANVAQAINFYQTEGLLHGRPAIHAADPAATQIIDNIRLTYKDNDVDTAAYPWIARTFTRRHLEIENDPRVWSRVESMIAANLPPTPASPSK